VGPEALAGGPVGKVRDGDLIQIIIDRSNLTGSIDFVGSPEQRLTPDQAARVLAERQPAIELKPDPDLPADTRLWALLQQVSGGTWGGCVYDVDRIEQVLRAGLRAELREQGPSAGK
jgi:dihydroxyacid dehydratase/phosphogluconate dehydratase